MGFDCTLCSDQWKRSGSQTQILLWYETSHRRCPWCRFLAFRFDSNRQRPEVFLFIILIIVTQAFVHNGETTQGLMLGGKSGFGDESPV